ncbi:MAG: GNAT family N-acetyltransferase [Anaerolineales bacterium]|nr:GNAT family N-acetyltransferase [Anaerolineales bacterium]
MLIRLFDYPADYPAVLSLWANAGPGIQIRRSDEPEEIRKKLLRDPDLFLVAEENNQIIGSVLGGFDGRRGIVYHLAVSPEQRRKGIGEQLMAELEQRLRLKGCIRCYLLVTQDNLEAIQFYEARGWSCMDLFVYGKDLA